MEIVTVTVQGCLPQRGGVGIDLNPENCVLDIRPDTAAERAMESGSGIQVGDKILSVDGMALNGVILTAVMQPRETHVFEVERMSGWSGFSIDETEVSETDEPLAIDRLREVQVRKQNGQLGITPEIHYPDGGTAVIKIAKVSPNTQASACGLVSIGDTIKAINGQPLTCTASDNPLSEALKVMTEVQDGTTVTLELESEVLKAGWMQKKGEKSWTSRQSWQNRFFVLVWYARERLARCAAGWMRPADLPPTAPVDQVRDGHVREGDTLLREQGLHRTQAEGRDRPLSSNGGDHHLSNPNPNPKPNPEPKPNSGVVTEVVSAVERPADGVIMPDRNGSIRPITHEAKV